MNTPGMEVTAEAVSEETAGRNVAIGVRGFLSVVVVAGSRSGWLLSSTSPRLTVPVEEGTA